MSVTLFLLPQANDFLESLAKEGESVEIEKPAARPGAPAATASVHLSTDPVTLNIDEKLTVQVCGEQPLSYYLAMT